jgi:hypothetical protein
MHTRRNVSSKLLLALVPALIAMLGLTGNAGAVPSFARQTGQECPACHVSWPELTPYGRFFKLTGYTIGKDFVSSAGFNHVPIAAMAQASISNVRNNSMVDPDTGDTVSVMPRQNDFVFSGGSLFFASKLGDYIGAFVQWTYDNLATTADGSLGGHSALDNTDLRAAYKYSPTGAAEPEWIFGLTLNNNPTMQDPWNSTPAWGYPYTSSPLAPTPDAATLIDGGLAQQVAGLGAYAFWKKTIYAEFSAYRTANVLGNVLRAGQPYDSPGGVLAITNFNPYWRVAYSHDWGVNSIMLGTYGMNVNVYPDNLNTTTPTDRYQDIALDAQYQYITDVHTFTAQTTYIWEKQSYNASYPITASTGAGYGEGPTPSNPTDRLRTFKIKGSYYYERKYGATLQYFQTTGSADEGLYGTTASGDPNSPNSNGYIAELDWLPIQNLRVLLQYTGYNKFNGASTNYDGNGRNAKDNNTLFFDVWVAF